MNIPLHIYINGLDFWKVGPALAFNEGVALKLNATAQHFRSACNWVLGMNY